MAGRELPWVLGSKVTRGQPQNQAMAPLYAPSCSVPGCSHPRTNPNLSKPQQGWASKLPSPGAKAGGARDPSPRPDSPRPVLLVVLSVTATLRAKTLGCQRFLVPLQLLPLQLPDGRADAAPLGQVQRCLQLGVTGQGSAPAPATVAPWLSPGTALRRAAAGCPRAIQWGRLSGEAHAHGTRCPALPGPAGSMHDPPTTTPRSGMLGSAMVRGWHADTETSRHVRGKETRTHGMSAHRWSVQPPRVGSLQSCPPMPPAQGQALLPTPAPPAAEGDSRVCSPPSPMALRRCWLGGYQHHTDEGSPPASHAALTTLTQC